MVEKSISSKRIVRTAPVEVSVVSTLPPGLDEGTYRVSDLIEDLSTDSFEVSFLPVVPDNDGGLDGGNVLPDSDVSLPIPQNIRVKSERIWETETGFTFIDVTLEADVSAGTHAVEVRFVEE